jgi:hypothetical protein
MITNFDSVVHPVQQLFSDTFAQWGNCTSTPLLDLGVESLALIGFLCRAEAELHIPLERLLGTAPLTLATLMLEYDATQARRAA